MYDVNLSGKRTLVGRISGECFFNGSNRKPAIAIPLFEAIRGKPPKKKAFY